MSTMTGGGLAEVFKSRFTESGGTVIDELPHAEGKTDYRSEVLRMKRHNAKAIVNLTYIKEGATILKQAYETGLKTQWLMGSASKSPKLVELAGEAAEGVIGTYPSVSQDTPEYQAFQTAWEKKISWKKKLRFSGSTIMIWSSSRPWPCLLPLPTVPKTSEPNSWPKARDLSGSPETSPLTKTETWAPIMVDGRSKTAVSPITNKHHGPRDLSKG